MVSLIQILFGSEESGLIVSTSKFSVCGPSLQIVGHIVSYEIWSILKLKMNKIITWPQPTTVTDIKVFLGVCVYSQVFLACLLRLLPVFVDLQGREWSRTVIHIVRNPLRHWSRRLSRASVRSESTPWNVLVLWSWWWNHPQWQQELFWCKWTLKVGKNLLSMSIWHLLWHNIDTPSPNWSCVVWQRSWRSCKLPCGSTLWALSRFSVSCADDPVT